MDLAEWTWWWEFNKEPILALRERTAARPTTGSDGYFLGEARSRRRGRSGRLEPGAITGRVIPSLLAALERPASPDIATAAMIALARIGEDIGGASAIEIEAVLRPLLRSAQQELAETATISLGILGRQSSALLLSALLLDTEEGRELVRAREVSPRTRAFAAYSLGLLAHGAQHEDLRRYAVHKLALALQLERTSSTPDIEVACVAAIGRIRLETSGEPRLENGASAPASGLEGEVSLLLGLLSDTRRHRSVPAQVALALGHLLDSDVVGIPKALREAALDALLDRLPAREREPREVVQSIAIAVGLLADGAGDPVDVRARTALLDLLGSRSDPLSRHLALISLARVAARDDQPDVVPARKLLLDRLARGNEESRWAALALALFERGRSRDGLTPSATVGVQLRDRLTVATSPLDVGAVAIACGIFADPAASAPLLDKLATVEEEQARGHVAIALGLLGTREAVAPLTALLERAIYQPRLLRELAIALSLLDDGATVDGLLGALGAANSSAAEASLAQALGRIGDQRALEPLQALLDASTTPARTRAFAAVALGLVADDSLLPWNTVLSVDQNWAAAPPTLYDQQGFGVLNIL